MQENSEKVLNQFPICIHLQKRIKNINNMKSKIIIIGLTLLSGAFIGLKSTFNTSVDEYNALLLENIEALAQEENEIEKVICLGNGSIYCPKDGKTGEHVKYLGIRDKVSLS